MKHALRAVATMLMLSVLVAGSWTQVALGQGERFGKYVNKYPSDLLKGESQVKRRLQTLLGANYTFFMERLQTETPIEVVKGILIARGCKAHQCGSEEAILLITLSSGTLHCAISSDRYNDKVKTFSEDPSHFPSDALKYALDN